MTKELVCIVEGQGDELSLPILLRRIAFAFDPSVELRCRTWRISKGALLKLNGLERDIELAARRYPESAGILVLIDADRDCPAVLGEQLLRRAVAARPDIRIGVVIAKCEFEAWFIAAIESLYPHADFVPPAGSVPDAEEVIGAKQWLAKHMRSGKYSETRHQPSFAQMIDLNAASRTRSFKKLVSESRKLLSI